LTASFAGTDYGFCISRDDPPLPGELRLAAIAGRSLTGTLVEL
jgi:hypothetical protein